MPIMQIRVLQKIGGDKSGAENELEKRAVIKVFVVFYVVCSGFIL